jgi:CheY-like chemotaxis protein
MRVLICDDDQTVRGYFGTMFELEGWETQVVASGEECLAAFDAGADPDVVILDQQMPGAQGLQVAEELRGRSYTRPIVLCSANIVPALRIDIARLDLLPINKVDVHAVLHIAKAALMMDQPDKAVPVQP